MLHMKKKKTSYGNRLLAFVLALAMIFAVFNVNIMTPVHAEGNTEYIYFDLAAGNISISNSTYTGYIYLTNGSKEKVTGTHAESNKYYVYQTNEAPVVDSTITEKVRTDIPTYTGTIRDFTNRTDVEQVITDWAADAAVLGRTSTDNHIDISCTGVDCDITLDDVWSTYQTNTLGSINITGARTTNTNILITLEGNNRLGGIRYYTVSGTTTSTLTFTSAKGDGSTEGSLVVIGDQTDVDKQSLYEKSTRNHWNSVIGGDDSNSNQEVRGIIINGGTIYAGATQWENCTAIGGGGNGVGEVTINGGKVTAVSSTTGAAIGGGIAHTGTGGVGIVTINNGEVYAYNYGQNFAETLSASGQNGMKSTTGEYGTFVPGTAIGGGSSAYQSGSAGTVTINGGTVYAESLGGSGIGGGNTVHGKGGTATVNITDGNVTSISKAGEIHTTDKKGNKVDLIIPSGAGIGGGSTRRLVGGEGTVTISGGSVITNGIGGGSSVQSTGGDATVDVSGGTITADSIGGGFSDTYGYAWGNVTVTGGSLNTGMAAVPFNEDGEMVYLTRITVLKDDVPAANLLLSGIEIDKGSTTYGLDDVYTDDNAMLYVWIPASSAVFSGTLEGNIYYPLEETDSKIDAKDIGILKYTSNKNYCIVNITSSEFYDIYYAQDATEAEDGTTIVEKDSTFTYYLQAGQDSNGNYYTIQPYIAVTDASGVKTFQRTVAMTAENETGLFSAQITISADTQIWYEITGTDGTHYFTIDQTNGNINITEAENGGIVIEQNGYKLSGFAGDIYLTTGGYPTANTFTVDCGNETVSVRIDEVNISADDSVIYVNSGTLNLTFSDADNLIQSENGSVVTLGEDGTLHIEMAGNDSLKMDGASGSPAVSGQGTLILNDGGGFLKLNEQNAASSIPEISVGTYQYSGDDPKYNAELTNGKFSFDLIGYVDKNGKLHKASDLGTDNTENFSARGIFRVYTSIEDDGGTIDANGNYVLQLEATSQDGIVGDVSVADEDMQMLTVGTDYTYNEETRTLTISGAAFATGNIIIFAAAKGQIPYMTFDYEGTYDGEAHGITSIIDTSRFAIYYSSTTPLNAGNYLDEAVSGKNIPTYTNVTNDAITTYWYIVALNDTEGYYTPVEGSNTVFITQGVNAWTKDLTCPDVVLGDVPQPDAEAKWGTNTIIYEYFKDKDGTEPVTLDTIKTTEGTYYVRATVPKYPENQAYVNYEAITTDYLIRFRVFTTSVFTANERIFDKATSADTTIRIPANGAFSIFYKTTCETQMGITFDGQLEAGTKLTLISYPVDEGETIQFYYYIINAEDYTEGVGTSVLLSDFLKMGHLESEGTGALFDVTEDIGKQVQYQFCIEANTAFNDKKLQVSFGGMPVITVEPYASTEAYFTAEPEASSSDGETRITVQPSVNGNGKRILSFIVDGISQSEMPIIVKLEDGTVPSLAVGDMFVFDLGTNTQIKNSYTLVLDYLTAGTYQVQCDIRNVDVTTELLYSLAGSTTSNRKMISVAVPVDTHTAIYADIVSSKDAEDAIAIETRSRIVSTSVEQMTFDIHTNETSISDISASLYVKQNGKYSLVASELNCSVSGDKKRVTITKPNNLPAKLPEGTYRLVFKLNDATCNYNIIVSDLMNE